MKENISKIGLHTGGTELTGLGPEIAEEGFLLADTAVFILAVYAVGTAAEILTPVGGLILLAEWVAFFAFMTPIDLESGVDEAATYVNFAYDPPENYISDGGYTYGEFESIVFIELRVPMANREGWSILPIDWHIGIENTVGQGEAVVSASTCTSIALYKSPGTPNSETTTFFEDFEGDISDWSVGDDNQDPEAGLDYWGIYNKYDFWGRRMYCAQIGNNSMHSGQPNSKLGIYGCYDKDMDAYLTRSVDVKPYQSFKLVYYLLYNIGSGDYLAVQYYINGQWNNATPNIHTEGDNFLQGGIYCETLAFPNTTEKIRFRFHSDNSYNQWDDGAFIDNVQIRAKLSNDANTMADAGNNFAEAAAIQISGSMDNYAGYLNDEDWYRFNVTPNHISSQKRICVKLNQPLNAVFNLTLYDPYSTKKAGPVSSGQALTYIFSPSDQNGSWRIRITPICGFGQYNFDILLPGYLIIVRTYKTRGSQLSNVAIWIDGIQYSSPVTIYVGAGLHTFKAESWFFRREWWVYTFDHWMEEGYTDNPIALSINGDLDLRAYYTEDYLCPTLFVWNGSEYVYETLLNIHAESDITVQHQIQQTLVPDGLFYKLQLRELDNFTSHIDQVKLYAVDTSGEWHMCPLLVAKHGDTYVTLKLVFDDDRRVDLAPTETINLKFLKPIPQDETSHFIFTINGHNRKQNP